MTRDEAIQLLKSGPDGVKKWNGWRRMAAAPLPDLSKADLSDAKLFTCNLSGANLFAARLSDSDLSGADLSGANLSESALFRASLLMAQLCGANLAGAEIVQADLTETNVKAAIFTKSYFGGTIFGDSDLSSAIGLETAHHVGPSHIAISTFYRSGGKIPDVFLRGCGVPEDFIKFIPSIINSASAIQFYSCFISYSHKDEDFAQRLYAKMQQNGLRVWYAPEDMKAGQKIHEQIDSAIRVHDKLLLVLSESSMASEWVATEIYHARQREKREGRKVLFPIALCPYDKVRSWSSFDADTGKDMAREVRELFVPDFSNWKDHDSFEKAFERLMRDLKADEGKPKA
jgi:hypothetical protein